MQTQSARGAPGSDDMENNVTRFIAHINIICLLLSLAITTAAAPAFAAQMDFVLTGQSPTHHS